MSVKMERLNNAFMEKISEILHDEVKDKDVKFVTITEVRITNDLSFAKVYFTSLEDDKKKITDALNKASGFIRSSLCEKIEIRKMPEIHFVYFLERRRLGDMLPVYHIYGNISSLF